MGVSRVTHTTWLHPAVTSIFAISLADIGARLLSGCPVSHQALADDTSNMSKAPTLLVLPCVWKVWNHGGYSARRRRAAGMDHDEQLHEALRTLPSVCECAEAMRWPYIVDVARCSGLEDEDYHATSQRKALRRDIEHQVHTILVPD
jgi:hypothetical protein